MLHQRKPVAGKSTTFTGIRPGGKSETLRNGSKIPASPADEVPYDEWVKWFDSPEGIAHREAAGARWAARSRLRQRRR